MYRGPGMKIYSDKRIHSTASDISQFLGKELWVLSGEYALGTSFYARFVDKDSYSVVANLVPSIDVDEAAPLYTNAQLNTKYILPVDSIWIEPTEVYSTDELIGLVGRGT